MKAGKIILFVIAGFSLIFSFLFFLASGGQTGGFNLIFIAAGLAGVGFVLIFFATRLQEPGDSTQNVTVNIDLPGQVGMDTIKCQSCGGVLSEKDIKLVAGAPMVSCPYCGTSYQLSEEPKW
jgi:inner membrane protein involved in colicin E2 resistance